MKTFKLLLYSMLLVLATQLQAQDYYIYVSDAGGFNNPPWQIMRYNLDGSNPQVFINNDFFVGEGVGWPQDILFLEDQGVVLISCLVGGRITKHNATTGAYIEDFAAVAGGPTRMKIGADNLIYVLQWSNTTNKVLRYQQDGTFVDEFTDVGVPSSIGLDWDAAGNLYVSSYGTSTITQFDTNGVSQGTFIDTQLAGPTNIYREPNGNYLVLNWNGGNVQRFDSGGTHLETFTTAVTQPEGISAHPINGNYLIGNGGNGSVDQFQPDGTFVENTIVSGSGGLIQPNAVVVREATLSVRDFSKKKLFVNPSMGTQFQINRSEMESIDALHVYNMFGQKIDTISNEALTWDAGTLHEGIYFLIGIEGKTRFFQKVIVKK